MRMIPTRDAAPDARALLERAFARDELIELLGTDDEEAIAHVRRATFAPLAEMLSRPGKGLRGRLVELAYAVALEGQSALVAPLPPELPQLIELLHAGSLIVDDIEDDAQNRRGGPALHRIIGVPQAINAGNLLYFLAIRVLEKLHLAPAAALSMHQAIGRCLVRCHHGQALDLSARVSEISRREVGALVELTSSLKTGALLELACVLGGIAGGASLELQKALGEFGCQVGVALQMLDDLSGYLNPARRDKALEDLDAQRATWSWALAGARLDDNTWAIWQRLVSGTEERAPALAALLSLMTPLLETFRARPRSLVEHALGRLRLICGDIPAVSALSQEIRALEQGFLQA